MEDAREVVTALLNAIVDRRLGDLVALYADRPATHVFPEGPRWVTHGHAAITAGWRAYADSPIRPTGAHWLDGPYLISGADLACVSGILRLQTSGRPVSLRLTWVLARTDNGWRIVHEHGSQPAADPYGTGDWLVEETA